VQPGVTISSIGHAAILGWGLVTFAVTPLETPRTEAMPVDLVSISEFTELRAGSKTAKAAPEQKQKAEKVAEPKPVTDSEKKPVDKPEPKKEAAAPPPPPPEPKPTEPKAEQKPEPKAEEVRVPEPPKKPAPPKLVEQAKPQNQQAKQRDFNPDRIAALLDKREPARQRTTGETPSPVATLGVTVGTASRLSQSEIDALRAQIQACWNPPVGAENAQELIVRLRIQFRPDGTLSAEPELMNRGTSPYFRVATESAMRAVRRCQPYTMPSAKYDIWKDVEVTFDPRDMFGGG
jgi:outer membrane biosynthesis protein TonB